MQCEDVEDKVASESKGRNEEKAMVNNELGTRVDTEKLAKLVKTANPRTAVQQPVKYTSAAVQPRVLATVVRQRLSSWAFSSPGVYRLLGLAQFSARLLLTAATTSGEGMVVAALSR